MLKRLGWHRLRPHDMPRSAFLDRSKLNKFSCPDRVLGGPQVRMSFWDSMGDVRMCQARAGALRDLFRRKFPDLPELEDDRRCDYCDIF